MLSNEGTDYHTVRDLDADERFALVQGWDLDYTLAGIGLPLEEIREFGCAFVWAYDGEYTEVYGCASYTPWLTSSLIKIVHDGALTPAFQDAIEYWAHERGEETVGSGYLGEHCFPEGL